ncbi:MAG: HRDC domain-containing protein [Nocardioides sp.]
MTSADDVAPLLTLREPLPGVTDTDEGLREAAAALSAGSGPVGIDAERASGYRYSNRAYLVQLRREGSGSWLIDPIAMSTMQPLVDALAGTEWILHAATQDLGCLAELGLRPAALFDTELAGRLLGYPRVGLGTLVEAVLGMRMLKEHSAADWSTRPLPVPWLEYAALDVEVLIELRDVLAAELAEAGKDEWARQEFDYLRGFEPTPRVDAWRRTSGMHRIRSRRGLGAVKALWEARDAIAQQRDVTPGRIIPDSAIVAAATALPTTRAALLATSGFHGRGAERYVSTWTNALVQVLAADEADLPGRVTHFDGPPQARTWADRDPVAARRLAAAKVSFAELGEERSIPVENMLTPDTLRRVLWAPPRTREPGELLDQVAGRLLELGARSWQVGLVAGLVADAIIAGDIEPRPEPEPEPEDAGPLSS